MKVLSLLIFMIVLFPALANVKVKVDPPNPVKEESFKVTFEVTTDTDAEPKISFYPIGLEVLGRNREVSISSSYINGKFTSQKKINYHYEMISDVSRVAKIKNIEVAIGDKVLRHPEVKIKILLKKKTPSPIFVQAELSKENAYVGEGIDLRYYLYTRVPVVQVEFKNFPKLNGFIKRFHKTADDEQTVERDGVIYKKILKYSGRIYPEKPGSLIIDPLHLNVQYATNRASPFGNFGLSFNRFRSRTIISKKVVVNVTSLPTENMPQNFTGLVGEHKFNFVSSKSKYVVNEAIEAKLEVIGPGALEKLEAPPIYDSKLLESFDTKSDFFEVGRSSGRKTFDYTYLARNNGEIPERKMSLSYFDPEAKKYQQVEVNIPGLIIGGRSASPSLSSGVSNNKNLGKNTENREVKNPTPELNSPVAPLFYKSWKGIPVNWPKWLLSILSLLVIAQIFEFAYSSIKNRTANDTIERKIKDLKKNGMSYSKVVQLLYRLSDGVEGEIKVKELVNKSGLSERDKKYFVNLLDALEGQSFSEDKNSAKKAKFKESSFRSLKRELSDANH